MMKKWRWFEIFLIVAIMAGAFYAAFSDAHNFPNRWFVRDDAYYYFKVAQNISEGLGSTFDGVNPTNGYHPLWMLVNIPIFSLARFDLVLPLRLLILVLGILSATTSVLLYRLLSRILSPPVGMLVAVFWGFNIYLYQTVTQFGLETGLTAFSIVLFLYLFEQKERKWHTESLTLKEIAGLGFAAMLVMFSRLDTVFLVLLFGLYIVFRKLPLRYFLLIDILGISFFGFVSIILRVGMKDYYTYGDVAVTMILLSLVVTLPTYYFLGLYHHPRLELPFSLLKRILTGIAVSGGIVSVLMLALGRLGLVESFPRSALLLNFGGLLLWLMMTRFGMRYLSGERERDTSSALVLFRENWQTWLREGLVYYGILGGALAAYMLFSKLLFGTSSPVSGQVKRWWGGLSGRVYGGPAKRIYNFFGLDTVEGSDYNAWGLVTKFVIWLRDSLTQWIGYSEANAAYWQLFFVIVILALVILLFSRKRTIRASVKLGLLPLFVGSFVQVVYYHATGYSSAKEWYWVSQILFTLFILALFLDILFHALTRLHDAARPLIWAFVAILSIVWLQSYYLHIANLMPYGVAHEGHPYMDVLAVMEENTEPGSLIGMTGGGNQGYFIEDRTIVNMDGLINSYDYFLAHKAGKADEYLADMGMDYVFVNPALLADLPYKGEFDGRLGEEIASFAKKRVVEFYQVERSEP
ncbi:MAG: hypothetical protein HN855_13750 [Anaerolineae bacterium]|jgi:uncharacterized membrane protein YhaH (DUF805 family)|nr:hypothetical protein [Anaerolineae bacterium]MBT7070590.1 hypothetical protein [Anaerolineae bacterium]MBT7326220.1 hypothetical protein [Anaerolineae bacterium]